MQSVHKLCEELACIPVERWQSSRLWKQPDASEVRWLKAASLKPIPEGPTLEVGLTPGGKWVVSAADQTIFPVEAEGDYLPLFPLLEMDYEEAREVLCREFSSHHLNADWLQHFPFESLIESALCSDLNFWPDRALLWVSESRIVGPIYKALAFLQKNGKTQQQRHQAMRLLSAHRRSNKK